MTGIQKNKLATFSTSGIRSMNVTVPLLGQNLVLAAPAAGYVRRVYGISVFNLENVTHDAQPQSLGGVPYGLIATGIVPGGTASWGPILLNAGEDLYIDMDAAWVSTGGPTVCRLAYEEFPVSSGIGGGLVDIAVINPVSPLVAAPPAGHRRVIGFNLQGVHTESEESMPRFIERANLLNCTIELTVAGQVVNYVDLPANTEQAAFDLRVVLSPGETLTARLIYTPPQYATAPPADATAGTVSIAAVLYWQDIAL